MRLANRYTIGSGSQGSRAKVGSSPEFPKFTAEAVSPSLQLANSQVWDLLSPEGCDGTSGAKHRRRCRQYQPVIPGTFYPLSDGPFSRSSLSFRTCSRCLSELCLCTLRPISGLATFLGGDRLIKPYQRSNPRIPIRIIVR